ncbi:MAG: hypothetical protein ACHP65_02090 [Legionellales bacterium]
MFRSIGKSGSSLQIAALFGPRFFAYHEIPEPKPLFPLPSSAETLETFFASEDGLSFKKNSVALLDKLELWASQQGIEADSAYHTFKRRNIEYTGSQLELNSIQLPLYQLGIPYLLGIVGFLDNADIALDARVSIIKNLTEGLAVCGPGVYTNITEAYWRLVSKLSPGIEWMVARRSIAEQIALEVLDKMGLPQSKGMLGMEIHHVNAVLNHFSEALAINRITDEYIGICDAPMLERFFKLFAAEIPKKLTPEAIITHIIAEQSIENLAKKTFFEIQAFEQRLERYGQDKGFSIHNLFEFDENELLPKLKWDYEDTLFMTLASRLIQSEYLLPEALAKIQKLPGSAEVTLHYVAQHSLRFAVVETAQEELKSEAVAAVEAIRQRSALIPYCVRQFQQTNRIQPELLDFILSTHWKDSERFELVTGIVKFIHSTIDTMRLQPIDASCFDIEPEQIGLDWFDTTTQEAIYLPSIDCISSTSSPMTDEKKLNLWLDLIQRLHPSGAQFDVILSGLPKAAHPLYIQRLGFANFKTMINSGEQLANVLCTLNIQHASLLLSQLGHKRLLNLIHTGSQLATVLNSLPEVEWSMIFDALRVRSKGLKIDKEHVSALLGVIFLRLPIPQWDEYCKKLYPSGWLEQITQLSQVCDVFHKLPADKARLFLQSIPATQLRRISINHPLLLFTEPLTESLLYLFQKSTKDKMALFLESFDLALLRDMFDVDVLVPKWNDIQMVDFLRLLPIEKNELLLNGLGQEFIDSKSFAKGAQILSFFQTLPAAKLTQLFSHLTKDKLLEKLCPKFFCYILFCLKTSPEKVALLLYHFNTEDFRRIFEKNYEIGHLFKLNDDVMLGYVFMLPDDLIPTVIGHIGHEYLREKIDLNTLKAHIPLKEPSLRNDKGIYRIVEFLGKERLMYFVWQMAAETALNLPKIHDDNYKDCEKEVRKIIADKDTLYYLLRWTVLDNATLARCILQWIRLITTLKNKPLEQCSAFLDDLDPQELLMMVMSHQKSYHLFSKLNKERSILLFSKLPTDQPAALVLSFKPRVDAEQSLQILEYLPKYLHKPLLAHWPIEQLPELIHRRDVLLAVLTMLERPNKVLLINLIGSTKLHSILLKDHKMNDALTFIRGAEDFITHRVLLLAVLRAHKEKSHSFAAKLQFWNSVGRKKDDAGPGLLERALLKQIDTAKPEEAQLAGMPFLAKFDNKSDEPNLSDLCQDKDLAMITHVLFFG